MTHPAEGKPLLPCPFCGGKAAIEQHGTMRQSCIIACEDCSCRLETGEVFDMGRAWNTRHSQGGKASMTSANLAAVIHEARFPEGKDAPNYIPFLHEDRSGREYCLRIARKIIETIELATPPSPAESVSQALAKVPNDLYWLIGKGKTHESEPLYACQIISPSDGTVMAEAEHDNLAKSITMAVSLLSREEKHDDLTSSDYANEKW